MKKNISRNNEHKKTNWLTNLISSQLHCVHKDAAVYICTCHTFNHTPHITYITAYIFFFCGDSFICNQYIKLVSSLSIVCNSFYLFQFVLLMLLNTVYTEYDFLCPDYSQWKYKRIGSCQNNYSYFCLFDENNLQYTEFCRKTPEFQRPGKIIYVM